MPQAARFEEDNSISEYRPGFSASSREISMLIPVIYLYRPDEDPVLFYQVRSYSAALGISELRVISDVAELPNDAPTCLVARVADANRAGDLLDGIREYDLPLSVLFLADIIRAEDVVTLVRAGAGDVLQRPLDRKRFQMGLKSAAASAATAYEKRCSAISVRRRFESLSPGEREVLRLILAGISNKRTAKVLGIAVRTVEARRGRIFNKLGTFSSAEIATLLITAEPSLTAKAIDLAALQTAVSGFRRAVRKRSRPDKTLLTKPSADGANIITYPETSPATRETDYLRSLIG